jgi:hypothetical protein
MHVDAAYGGAAMLAPSARDRFAGIEHADSMIVDPHKWLYAPFDCAALLYRDPQFARTVHTHAASYLDVIHDDTHEWNPSDYAYQLRGSRLAAVVLAGGSGTARTAATECVLAIAPRPTHPRFPPPVGSRTGCRSSCSVELAGPRLTTTPGRRDRWPSRSRRDTALARRTGACPHSAPKRPTSSTILSTC